MSDGLLHVTLSAEDAAQFLETLEAARNQVSVIVRRPPEVEVYRVNTRNHPVRVVRWPWWRRTWQAEWSDCRWCPRAYTERGVRRKAARWRRWSPEHIELYVAVHRWARRYLLRRP